MSDAFVRFSRLFKRCLHLGNDASITEHSLNELQRGPVADLEEYFDRGETQIAPLLYWHLARKGLTSRLDDRFVRPLGRRYHANIARNALLEQSLERIAARFADEDVEVLVLKGACVFTTALSLFREAFVLYDLDLLIKSPDVGRATRLLMSDGYHQVHHQQMDGESKQTFARGRVTRVELHSALFWTTTGVKYLDYGPADLWQMAVPGSIGAHRVTTLSPEDQIVHRLVHDGIAHGASRLASSTCRLYYFCVLADFFRDKIDWGALLHKLTSKGTDRLLLGYMYYGHRELGLILPPELQRLERRGSAAVALIDAEAAGSDWLSPYAHQVSLAVLTGRTRQDRLRKVWRLFADDCIWNPIDQWRHAPPGPNPLTNVVKMLCLQLAAVLHISMYALRHSMKHRSINVR